MSSDITIQAARLALGMDELRARIASVNIANAGMPGTSAMRIDFSRVEAALQQASVAQPSAQDAMAQTLQACADSLPGSSGAASGDPIHADAEVADMAAAGASYQALSEGLSRHFGLLRLAISGRS